MGTGERGEGDKIKFKRTVQKRYATLTGLSNILSHLPHAARFKKLYIPKLLQKQYATMNFMYYFPTATCCNTFSITTNYHSPSPSSSPPSHHHHQHLSFYHHHHHRHHDITITIIYHLIITITTKGNILFAVLTATQVLTPF